MNFYFEKPLMERLLLSFKERRFLSSFRDYAGNNIYYYPVALYRYFNSYFKLGDKRYRYYVSKSDAVVSERSVELPILEEFYNNYHRKGCKFLEVGNVLNVHKKNRIDHTVVDKYEVAKGVINEDIVNYKPKIKYDIIASISTLEHVGFDELPKDSNKLSLAMKNVLSLLKPQGKLLITMPIGYNPAVDQYVKTTKLRKQFMIKNSVFNDWIETDEQTAFKRPYNSIYKRDNAIVILREN